MDIAQKHEIFEIEVLEKLKNTGMLEPLVFGGGTMLRLCHELNRYSVDLDFWFIKELPVKDYFERLKEVLGKEFEITDAQDKFNTLLFEIRSTDHPKRLKIEIRKEIKDYDLHEQIAFSRFSNTQVAVRTCSLEQSMKNKIAALLDRKEIRDSFDIEFLLRKGIPLPPLSAEQASDIKKVLDGFNEKDFKVKLGSILESDARQYYIANGFAYLRGKISPV